MAVLTEALPVLVEALAAPISVIEMAVTGVVVTAAGGGVPSVVMSNLAALLSMISRGSVLQLRLQLQCL